MKSNLVKFAVTVLCIIASFYIAVILHECGHGTVAWAFGYKQAFYDVEFFVCNPSCPWVKKASSR